MSRKGVRLKLAPFLFFQNALLCYGILNFCPYKNTTCFENPCNCFSKFESKKSAALRQKKGGGFAASPQKKIIGIGV